MATIIAPPRTPSPKIRIHRSQSFDSPSSRISVTPIDDSPYSKSASAIIAKPLPQYDLLKTAERCRIVLHTKHSEDSLISSSSSSSSIDSSPTSPTSPFALFASGSPSHSPTSSNSTSSSSSSSSNSSQGSPSPPPQITESTVNLQLLQYQDSSTPMYDPWLVRVVLDLYDVRGFDWTMIAEPIGRIWGCRTSSAEVLGILSANGRVGRAWWD